MNQSHWDHQADVVVVGGGGAGLAAALEASNLGVDVLLIEKMPQLGGTTSIAVGSFTAAGTSMQKAAGIEDSPAWHDEDIGKFAPELEAKNEAYLRRHFVEHAAETFEWLRGMGLSFQGPNPEPPNRVPRMHNVVPNAKAYIATLQQRLLRNQVRILYECALESLEQDESGAVVGVQANYQGEPIRIQVKHGVVLASGDYSNSEAVKNEYLPEEVAGIEGINPNSEGDGHRIARQAGAQLMNMEVVYGPELRFVPPPRPPFAQLLPASPFLARFYGLGLKLMPKPLYLRMVKSLLVTWQHPEKTLFENGAILVNRQGERFVEETKSPEWVIAKQPEKIAYIIMDNAIAEPFSAWPNFISTAPEIAYAYIQDYKRLRPDLYAQAPSVIELAEKLDLPAKTLGQTVLKINQIAGRPSLNRPPYFALGPVKSWLVTTEGGIRINTEMQALSENGRVIPGLYAAGSAGMGGIIVWGHGLHIAWAFTSGRLAGRHAAQRAA